MSAKERSEEEADDESYHREDDLRRPLRSLSSSSSPSPSPSPYKKKKKMRLAKQAVLSPFRKVKRLILNTNNTSSPSPPPPPSSAAAAAAASKSKHPGKTSTAARCYLCYMKPLTSDSPTSAISSQTSDPNSPTFSYDLCKALIERNDFFSKECNVHLDNVISHT